MANHRRKHPGRNWHGCAMCKFWTSTGIAKDNPIRERWSDHTRRVAAQQAIKEES